MRPLPALLFALLVCVGQVRAADLDLGDAPFEIEADKLVYEQDRNVYEASGNVLVTQAGGRSLSAEWVAFNAETRLGVAVGDVVLREGDDVLRADFATVDFNTLRTMATHASVDSGSAGFLISGESVRRTGEKTYDIKSGMFTTCRCPKQEGERAWEVRAGEAEVEVDGYAVARDVTFRVLGVPVFYTPWLALPVMTSRKTGLLVPEFELSGRNGTLIGTPFFWAVNDSLNLLLRPQWLSKRGFKNGAEVEYLFGEEGEGEGGFGFLGNDRQVKNDDIARDYSPNRWAYWLRADQPLDDVAEGLHFGTDINVASDNDYVVDFDDLGERRRDRFLDARAWLGWAHQAFFAGVQTAFNDDLQSPNNLDRDDYMLQRLPEVDVSTLPLKLGSLPLFAGLDAEYTFFHQSARDKLLRGIPSNRKQFFDTGRDGTFDVDEPTPNGAFPGTDVHVDNFGLPNASEGDGFYQEGELLADYGHRIDLYPRVTLPARVGPVETLTETGFRETIYAPRFGSSETREIWTGRFDSRIRLARNLGVGARRVRHVVEPKFGFTFVETDDSQKGNPLFVPEAEIRARRLIDGDPRVLTRDPSDRVADERVLNASIGNRFYAEDREIGSLRLGSGYDFELDRTTDFFLDGHVSPHDNARLGGLIGYDAKKTRLDEASFELMLQSNERYRLRTEGAPERRHVLGISYRYLRDRNRLFEDWLLRDSDFDDFDDGLERIDQLDLSSRLALVRQVDLFAQGFWSFESSKARGGSLGLLFLSDCGCWDLSLTLQHRARPSDTRFQFSLRLAGLGGKR